MDLAHPEESSVVATPTPTLEPVAEAGK